jgi:hypothetical protein
MLVFKLTKLVKEVLTMSYHDTVSALAGDAEQLEALYQSAVEAGEAEAFKQAIDDAQTGRPREPALCGLVLPPALRRDAGQGLVRRLGLGYSSGRASMACCSGGCPTTIDSLPES